MGMEGVGILASGIEGMAAGNIIAGGVIGLGVDVATGAMNKYPDELTVAMIPDPACARPPATTRR
jgi:phosphoketolase